MTGLLKQHGLVAAGTGQTMLEGSACLRQEKSCFSCEGGPIEPEEVREDDGM